MNRPSISLCMIVKNEAHNLGGLLQSVKGCFDAIHITDTGSTDNTLEFIDSINRHIAEGQPQWAGLPHIDVHHFDWVDDFSAARNFSFSRATTDYVCWMDGDDLLSDAKAFIHWRDNVMHSAHYWLAKYNYAYNDKGDVICQFVRERVVKNNYGFKWHYFVHEGLLQTENRKVWTQLISSWTINHRRSEEDIKQDHNRNIRLFEKKGLENLESRMKFYFGKELFENGKPVEAGRPLMEALKDPNLQLHDRMLSFQYAAQSAFAAKAYDQAIQLCMSGLTIMPARAELWCILGDSYLSQGRHSDAILAYKTATNSVPDDMQGILVNYGHAYEEWPLTQLARIHLQLCNMDEAKKIIDYMKVKGYPVADQMLVEYHRISDLNTLKEGLPKSQDVVITCPPGGPVTDWDEGTLKSKGHGGSETAAIEVAAWIKKKTNRPVKIFQQRQKRDVMPSGVEYVPVSELTGYIHNVEPYAHIAWRHPTPLTKAKTYVWCHDLQCPGAQNAKNYDKIVALSGFHKEYLKEVSGVPDEKIVLGFNGINPDDFKEKLPKDPLKVVFSSSPDRGLVQTIDIVKKAREISGLDIKLHCFYGFENMRKGGLNDWADSIEKKIKDNSDFVVHHGMVNKSVLMKHFKEAGVWLYPADFIETYCITAIEALCAGTWGIVRSMGALPYTLKEAIEKGMVDMTDVEAVGDASVGIWANLLHKAILEKKWERVKVDPQDYSWEKVADFFIKELNLEAS